MQFRTAVGRPGKASAPEDPRVHPEIFSIFLHHDIRGGLAGPEDAVLGIIDTHGFVDTEFVIRMRGFDLPARFPFHEGKEVWSVPVNFIGAGEDENGLRAVKPGGFEQVKGAGGIHAEIGKRFLCRPVVRGLCGGMNHTGNGVVVLRKDLFNGGIIPDIRRIMPVIGEGLFEFLTVPPGTGPFPEEIGPHVIVDTRNAVSLFVKKFAGFTSDETCRAGNKYSLHKSY